MREWHGFYLKTVGLVFLCCLSIVNPLLAQEADYYKVKKVKAEDFQIESDLIDETSLAVYLYNIGYTQVLYAIGERPEMRVTIKYRVKILDQGGLDEADVIIPLYVGERDDQSFVKASGGVYNLVDGEVEFDKLKRSDWFVESLDDNHNVARISFKNARVGSIIELEYVVNDPFYFRPDDWVYQFNDIPVLYSEFTFSYPEVMHFSLLKFGYHPLAYPPIVEEKVYAPSANVSGASYLRKSYCFISEDIPAMTKEPLMDSRENYRSQIMIELKAFNVIGGTFHEYYSTWESAIGDFMENEFNADYMSPKQKWGYFYCDSTNNQFDSIAQIYQEIALKYEISDALNYMSPERSPKDVMLSTLATRTEINWICLSTLRANGIEAYPVLYSPRSRERVHKQFAIISQFSRVMIAVATGDGYMLLDPSNKGLAMGEISEFSMNGEGFVLNDENPEWIPMKSKFQSKQRAVIEFTTVEGGIMKGKMKLKLEGIYAHRFQQRLELLEEFDAQKLLPIADNMELTLTTKFIGKMKQPVELEFDVSYPLEKFGDSYLFPAVLYDAQDSNPLKGETRLYPINFPDTWTESYTCLVHLDTDKYEVTSPDRANFVLPNEDARFTYSVSQNLGNLVVRSQIEMNNNNFQPNQYSTVRQLYDLISTSQVSFIEITEK